MIRLLVVDDSLFMRQMLKTLLPKDKFEIIGDAATGREAVQKFLELRPDIVTMDITMPDMDGMAAVRKIIEEDSSAKVVMCSAMGQKPMVKEAIEAGAKDFIVKPFDKDKAIKILEKVGQEI